MKKYILRNIKITRIKLMIARIMYFTDWASEETCRVLSEHFYVGAVNPTKILSFSNYIFNCFTFRIFNIFNFLIFTFALKIPFRYSVVSIYIIH